MIWRAQQYYTPKLRSGSERTGTTGYQQCIHLFWHHKTAEIDRMYRICKMEQEWMRGFLGHTMAKAGGIQPNLHCKTLLCRPTRPFAMKKFNTHLLRFTSTRWYTVRAGLSMPDFIIWNVSKESFQWHKVFRGQEKTKCIIKEAHHKARYSF